MPEADSPDELEIHGCRIKIDFPEELLNAIKVIHRGIPL